MERFQTILFPVDFSERCLAVSPAVAAYARQFRARVTLLHVLNLPPGAYQDWYAYLNLVDRQSVQAEVERNLHRFLVEQFAGVEVRRELADGDPAAAIVKYVHDEGADLVMMPTRGHGRFRARLLGSVTAKVLHDTHVPVWTEAHAEEAAVPLEVKSILCAVDMTPRSIGLLKLAFGLAADFGARCHAIFADEDGTQASAARAEEVFARYAADAGIEAGLEVVAGSLSEAAPRAVAERGADLLVAGRGGYDSVRSAGCPVLSV